MADAVTAFATIRAKPEHFADARAAIEALVPDEHAEKGCNKLQLHAASDQSGTLHLWEGFSDEAALSFHHQQPCAREVFAAYARWLAEPVSIQPLAPASGMARGAYL